MILGPLAQNNLQLRQLIANNTTVEELRLLQDLINNQAHYFSGIQR